AEGVQQVEVGAEERDAVVADVGNDEGVAEEADADRPEEGERVVDDAGDASGDQLAGDQRLRSGGLAAGIGGGATGGQEQQGGEGSGAHGASLGLAVPGGGGGRTVRPPPGARAQASV